MLASPAPARAGAYDACEVAQLEADARSDGVFDALASPDGDNAASRCSKPARRKRRSELDGLAPFAWDLNSPAVGPALMRDFVAEGARKRSRALEPSAGAVEACPAVEATGISAGPSTCSPGQDARPALREDPPTPITYPSDCDEDEDAPEADAAANSQPDACSLPRSVLEALCMEHLGRDLSKCKLAKRKLVCKLSPAVLAEALAAAAAKAARGASHKAAKKAAAAGAGNKAADKRSLAADAAAAAAARRAEAAALDAARVARNADVAARAAAAAPLREATLARHLSVLRPFVPPDVADRLQAALPPNGQAPHATRASLPRQVLAQLRPHQKDGFRWLTTCYASGLHPILGDEMGLGKTLQAISLLAHATFSRTSAGGPHLVVCPLSVLPSWQAELARWCPALRCVRAHGAGDAAEKARCAAALADVASYDVALTTYDTLLTDGPLGRALRGRAHWDVLVLDEGHKVKNEAGALGRAVRSMRTACTLLLSGTLLQNNMHELWALLNLLYPDVFTDATPFDAAFQLDGEAAGADEEALRAAHALLRVLCLRREKADVERSLPPKTETRVLCPLAPRQAELYKAALRRSVAAVDGAADTRTLNSLCMELRLICCHPRLIELSDDEDDTEDADAAQEEAALQALLEASGKLAVLDRLLARLKAGGHRVVIFSQFVSMLAILARYLKLRGHAHARLDGGVCRARRAVDVMRFNAAGSDLFAFLVSTKAGGLGLNLQSADTVILFDSDWNPQADVQAMARCHRIGQTKPVHVFRMVSEHSVEERVVERAEKKLYLDAVVARGAGSEEGWTADDLRYGADALFRSELGAAPSEAELDALCDRTSHGDARRAEMAALRKAAAPAAAADLSAPPPPLRSLLPEEDAEEARREAAEAAAKRAAAEANLPRAARRTQARKPEQQQQQQPSRSSRQVAGKDYAHSSWCQVCWDGGDLFCCDVCPAAYHAECIDEDAEMLGAKQRWSCPHHACAVCARTPAAAGGLLFRCEACELAFCDEHLPEDVLACGRLVNGGCDRFRRLGQVTPTNALFIHCSEECAGWAAQGFGLTADDLALLAPPAPPAWVHDGDDELMLLSRRTALPVPLRKATFAQLKAFLLQLHDPAAPLPGTGATALRNVLAADGDAAFAALYTAAREDLLRGAQLPPERGAAVATLSDGDDGGSGSDDDASLGSGSSSDSDDGMAGLALDAGGQVRALAADGRRRRVHWSAEETQALLSAVAECGTRWAAVHEAAARHGVKACRTQQDLSRRFYLVRQQYLRHQQQQQQMQLMQQQQEQQKEDEAAGAGASPDSVAVDSSDAGAAPAPVSAAPAPLPAFTAALQPAHIAADFTFPPSHAATPRRRRVLWSGNETAALRALVAEFGVGRWAAIRQAGVARGVLLPLRSAKDVSCRWAWLHRTQDSAQALQRLGWSPAEEAMLVALVRRHGNDWPRILADPDVVGTQLAQRTTAQLYDKWRSLQLQLHRVGHDEQPGAAADAAGSDGQDECEADDEGMDCGDGSEDAFYDAEEVAPEEAAPDAPEHASLSVDEDDELPEGLWLNKSS